ncbi:MAG TPA: hypothetical protein VIV83_14615 [Gemmatimonadales bacterium]
MILTAVVLVLTQQPVVLTSAQRAKLAALGWPPAPPVVRARDDMLFRRDGGEAVTGSLSLLHAFATVTTPQGDVRVPREQISMILVNGALLPANTPVLPLDSDAVVLPSGEKIVGPVDVDGDAVHAGARVFPQSAIAFIRLRDPKASQGAVQAAGANGAPSSTTTTTGQAGAGAAGPAGAGSGAGAARPRPRGPNEIPWGQAVWRGVVRFSTVSSSLGETESGTYYATFAESAIGRPPYLPAVRFRVQSLVYQYQLTEPKIGSCAAFTASKQGSGVDGWNPNLHSGGMISLPMQGRPATAAGVGKYNLDLFAPVFVPAEGWPKVCTTGGPPTSAFIDGNPLPSITIGSSMTENNCRPNYDSLRAMPPFTTIAGEIACGTSGVYPYLWMKWQFDRGVPPVDPTMTQDPCETPKGLLSLSQDQRQRAADRLKQIGVEFAAARDQEARTRQARDQLQPAFDLLIVAAAGSDLGQKLLQLALGDGMLKTAAATGEITEAQQAFIGNLNTFIKSYEAWTKFADNPGGWGESKLIGAAKSQAVGADNMEIIQNALELVGYGKVLAGAIGQGNGSEALDYIEENLGALGPLVPDYAISKGREYVDVSRQWASATRTMSRLAAEGANLASQIAEADLGIAVRQRALADCTQANPSK